MLGGVLAGYVYINEWKVTTKWSLSCGLWHADHHVFINYPICDIAVMPT